MPQISFLVRTVGEPGSQASGGGSTGVQSQHPGLLVCATITDQGWQDRVCWHIPTLVWVSYGIQAWFSVRHH